MQPATQLRARSQPARVAAGALLLLLPLCALLLVAQLPTTSATSLGDKTASTASGSGSGPRSPTFVQRLQSLGRRLRHGIERKDQCLFECCSPNGSIDLGHCDSDKNFCVDHQCVACVADSTADSTCMRMTQGRRPRCLANQCIEHPNNGNGGGNSPV